MYFAVIDPKLRRLLSATAEAISHNAESGESLYEDVIRVEMR